MYSVCVCTKPDRLQQLQMLSKERWRLKFVVNKNRQRMFICWICLHRCQTWYICQVGCATSKKRW